MFSLPTHYIFSAIDASGKLPAGILDFRIAWEGDYQECLRLHIDYNEQKFNGRYCTVMIPLQAFTAGFAPQPQNVILLIFRLFIQILLVWFWSKD